MNRSIMRLRWIVPLALASALAYLLFPNESARLRERLIALAATGSVEEGPPSDAKLTRVREAIALEFANPVTVELAELGESSRAPEELLAAYRQYVQGLQSLRFRLNNVQVELGDKAVARGELSIERVEPGDVARVEPRRFSVTFAKREAKWRIVHLEITASRIDEPEARP